MIFISYIHIILPSTIDDSMYTYVRAGTFRVPQIVSGLSTGMIYQQQGMYIFIYVLYIRNYNALNLLVGTWIRITWITGDIIAHIICTRYHRISYYRT